MVKRASYLFPHLQADAVKDGSQCLAAESREPRHCRAARVRGPEEQGHLEKLLTVGIGQDRLAQEARNAGHGRSSVFL